MSDSSMAQIIIDQLADLPDHPDDAVQRLHAAVLTLGSLVRMLELGLLELHEHQIDGDR